MSQSQIDTSKSRLSCFQAGLAFGILTLAAWVGHGTDVGRVSVAQPAPAATTATGASAAPFFSGDGRQVIFQSNARDIVQNPMAGFGLDVIVRDLATRSNQLISVSADSQSGGDLNSEALGASRDGSRILFLSDATNLVLHDTNKAPDLFVRDRNSHQTLHVTRGVGGEFLPDIGRPNGLISEDGRRVFFDSTSTQLVSGDRNLEADIFQHDLATRVTTRINLTSTGSEALGGPSRLEAVSASGNRVVFTSMATNLAPVVMAGKTATTVYVCDLESGSLRRLYVDFPPQTFGLVNLWDLQLQAVNVVISPEGRYVAFATVRRFENDKITARGHIFWFDLETGASAMASGDRNAGTYNALPDDSGPVMSEAGRTIAFEASFESPVASVTSVMIWRDDGSIQTLENPFIDALIPPPHAVEPVLSADGKQLLFLSEDVMPGADIQLYRHRLDYSGPLDFGFQAVAVRPDGSPAGGVQFSSHEFSPDGDRVLYDSTSDQITTLDKNNGSDVFVRELGTLKTELLSTRDASGDSLAANGVSTRPVITSNGRYVVFVSLANNLAGVDENQHYDVFRRDLETGLTELVSATHNGQLSPNFGASSPSVSSDGRWIAFVSGSTNLVAHGTAAVLNVYLRDMQSGVTRLVSRSSDGLGSGDAPSIEPVISADGSVVVFLSRATNMVADTPVYSTTGNNVFAYNRLTDTIALLSKTVPDSVPFNGAQLKASTSQNGQTVAFLASGSASSGTAVMVIDASHPMPLTVHTNSRLFGSQAVWVSQDGNGVVFEGSDFVSPLGFLARYDTRTGQMTQLPLPAGITRAEAPMIRGVSRDGMMAVFTCTAKFNNADTNAAPDVFLARFDRGEINLVSGTGVGWIPGDRGSDSPALALDGSRVVFRSLASNLVEGDFNGLSDIFEYDIVRRTTSLVSINRAGFSSNGRSSQPVISGDGARIAFVSWAEDLDDMDVNGVSDVFVASNFNSSPGDSDRDGLPDVWELAEFGTLLADPNADDDVDGASNLFEYWAGTKPKQSSSVFHPRMLRSTIGGVLVWDGIVGRKYTVEVANEPSGPWISLGTVEGRGNEESLSVPESEGGSLHTSFYRIRVQ